MSRKVKIGIVGILLLSIMIPAAISVSNGIGNGGSGTTSVDNTDQANVPTQEQTIDQIIAQKRAKDHPTSIIDKVGKLSKNLSEKVKKAGPNDKIRVAIWVKDDGVQEIPRPSNPNQVQTLNNVNANTNVSDKQKPLKDYLESKNLRLIYASEYAPVVFAEMTKADIKDLESRDDVTLMQSEIQNEAMIDNSVPSVLAPPVWNYVSGGIQVAVVEPDGIAFANPYLNDGYYWIPTNPYVGAHATAVAGIIASTNPTYRGVAYKGPALLSANSQTFYDSDLMAASEWAMRNGARVLSNSWGAYTCGSFTAMTYYYDYIVKNYPWATVIFAAGNGGQGSYPCNTVIAPAIGYNVLSVGSFDDQGTGWIWSDDIMSYFSSYGAVSPHGDRKLPNVVAVGAHNSLGGWGLTSTTTSSPWIGQIGMGTSYAAPEVSGEASLLMATNSGLSWWPEGIRAITMASADHNIEGYSRLSVKDGTGGINVIEAYNIAANNRWTVGGLSYNSFPWYGPNIVTNQGQKIRAVFTWDSKSTGYTGTDILDADLDLFIQRLTPSGWIYESKAGASTSWDNNYEIVEFNAPESGTYRVLIYRYRWDDPSSYTYFGYATYIK